MRLLDTETTTISDREFNDPSTTPPYAIVSHCWGNANQEVSFRDVQTESGLSKASFAKIHAACVEASKDGLKYLWMDTCCIDNTSSAELSEAINSMYAWYEGAEVCYAYLGDVTDATDMSQFGASRWFTRGWTLQELLAPASVIFFSSFWIPIGTKLSLASVISRITQIPEGVLTHRTPGPGRRSLSVATRMSWAAGRKTTRVEDRAYSLMGIFGVHMPTLYGEGERAFKRLQQEIMKVSNDYTIFAWRKETESCDIACTSGLLASSPDDFKFSTSVRRMAYSEFAAAFLMPDAQPEFSLTNCGIRIRLPLVPIRELEDPLEVAYIAYLPCGIQLQSRPSSGYYGIRLRQRRDHFVRTDPHRTYGIALDELAHFSVNSYVIQTHGTIIKTIYVKEPDPSPHMRVSGPSVSQGSPYVFEVNIRLPPRFIIDFAPRNVWRADASGLRIVQHPYQDKLFGLALIRSRSMWTWFAVVLGVHKGRVWSDAWEGYGEGTAHDIAEHYFDKSHRGTSRRELYLDCISEKTTDGRHLSVLVRRGVIDGMKGRNIAAITLRYVIDCQKMRGSRTKSLTIAIRRSNLPR